MQQITESVLQKIAGTIEALLLEQQEGIAFAHDRIREGMKVTLSIDLDHSAQGLVVNYSMSYPLEPKPETQTKEKIKKKEIINEDQTTMTLTYNGRTVEL